MKRQKCWGMFHKQPVAAKGKMSEGRTKQTTYSDSLAERIEHFSSKEIDKRVRENLIRAHDAIERKIKLKRDRVKG